MSSERQYINCNYFHAPFLLQNYNRCIIAAWFWLYQHHHDLTAMLRNLNLLKEVALFIVQTEMKSLKSLNLKHFLQKILKHNMTLPFDKIQIVDNTYH